MQRLLVIVLIFAAANLSTACMATRKFVRGEVKTTSDTLNARVDTTDGEVAEVRDGVHKVGERVTGVDGRVSELDSKTSERFEIVNGEVRAVDQKAAEAHGAVTVLDQKFQNRNQFSVTAEKAVYFKFNSAKLDAEYQAMLDEIAEALTQNPDALIVMEGRTDSTGNQDYNIKLGERRIEAVKRYLAVEKGVPVYKIHNISFGAARPVAPNDNRAGREKNRAVTMMILVPRAEGAVVQKNNNN